MMLIKAFGGLCNRLRVILSYLASNTSGVKFIWEVNSEVSYGHFRECFEPIEGVEFVEKPTEPIDITTFDVCGNAPRDWHHQFSKLTPKPHIEKRVRELQARLKTPYAALHIRRTDHVELAKQFGRYTSDKEFLDFIRSIKNSLKIYLATDNASTQIAFRNECGESVVYAEDILQSSRVRQTSLEVAVIDLFVCAGSTVFKGSGFSSFSESVEWLRACSGVSISTLERTIRRL